MRKADPTGVGDAFRAGFLTGLAWGLDHRRCAEVGSMLATYVIETVGTQEYELGRARFLQRLAEAYGAESAAEIEPHLACPPPLSRDGMPVEPPASLLAASTLRARRRPVRTSSASAPTCAPGTLLAAYRIGLFPMGVGPDGAPPLGWWSPDPRGVLLPGELRVSRSLRKACRTSRCGSTPRSTRSSRRAPTPPGTGAGSPPQIARAYAELHRARAGRTPSRPGATASWSAASTASPIGGLFAGESMFHHATDASKVALVALADAASSPTATRAG